MPNASPFNLHACCIAIDGKGVLLLGESGSGKSSLALRLIDGGASLVSDDRVELRREEGLVIASPPDRLCGLLEIRGIGLLKLPFMPKVTLTLAIELGAPLPERMPKPAFFDCLGVQLPLLSLHDNDISAPAKIRACLRYPLLP